MAECGGGGEHHYHSDDFMPIKLDDGTMLFLKKTMQAIHYERIQIEVQCNRFENLVKRMEAIHGK